ncbi:hypothetical protein GH733_011277 [Mirounga leonina]|nr:hypothetical protein GH733_011277 [Mirounga leonina]
MGILLPGQTRIKRRRRVMPLEDKMKILEKLEEGVSNTDVGRLFGVNESTVRTIKKNEKAIRASMESVSPVSSKVLCVPRDVNIEKMETELTFWVEDQTIGGRPLTLKAICSQAKRIYKQLVETTGNGNPDKFHASKGWFEKFRNRYSLRNSRANEEVAKIVESAKRMDFKFLDIEEGEINELLKFQALAITERESVSINAEEDKSPEPEVKMNLRKLNAVLRQASDLIDAAIDMDPFLDRSLAFKKDFNKLLYTYKEVQKNLQNKAKELKKEKDTNKEEVVWMKKMDTESESEGESESESESKSESESHKEEQVERRKEDKKPPEEDPGPSSSSTETLTISEESAKAINAELDFWNLTLELNLERVDVPELKEENPEAVPSK